MGENWKRDLYTRWLTVSEAYSDSEKEALKHMNYSDYLLTAWWETIRVLKLQLEDETCGQCGTGFQLEVHHKTYETKGDELPCDLEILCRSCHQMAHLPEKDSPVFSQPSLEFKLLALAALDGEIRDRILLIDQDHFQDPLAKTLFSKIEKGMNMGEVFSEDPSLKKSLARRLEPFRYDDRERADVLQGLERLRLKREREMRLGA